MIARINSAGARIRSANALSGVFRSFSVKIPAPRKVITEVTVPAISAKAIAP